MLKIKLGKKNKFKISQVCGGPSANNNNYHNNIGARGSLVG
jgi:hypothetical protein